MDPNACLAELRSLTTAVSERGAYVAPDTVRMAELVDALDGWLSRGGFLPRAWENGRNLAEAHDTERRLSLTCPFCGALPKAPCRRGDGQPTAGGWIHGARR